LKIGAYAYNKDSPTALCDSEVLSVEDLPLNTVSGEPITAKLILQQFLIGAVRHAIDVFDDKSFGLYDSEHSIELLVQKVDPVL
jgi:hypothetical protein